MQLGNLPDPPENSGAHDQRIKGYRYDVFVSYRHDKSERARMTPWIRMVLDMLGYWLEEERRGEPVKIFFDKDEIEVGNRWPDKLRESLLSSRCLLPFWSPKYFHSSWCLTELKSFLARERLLQKRRCELIVPIKFHDGQWFPDEVKDIWQLDLSEYAFTTEGFSHTAGHVELERVLKKFARTLANAIDKAPPFQEGWPIEDSESSGPPYGVPMRRL